MKPGFPCILLCLLAWGTTAFSQPSTVSLPSNFSATAGTQIQIPITVTDFDSVCNITLAFSFDTTVLSCVGYNINPLMGQMQSGNRIGNQFRFAWYDLSPLSLTDGDWIVIVTFDYMGGTSVLEWVNTPDFCVIGDCNLGVKSCTWTDGSVVPPPPPLLISGTLYYDNANQPSLPQATLILYDEQGEPLDTTQTGIDGLYSFEVADTGMYVLEILPSLPWNSVNATDALRINQHFVGQQLLTGLALEAADVNGSGYVNAGDALLVLKRFVGLQNTFPTGDWVFDIPPVHVQSQNPLVINIPALLYGDVDRSYNP